MSQGMCPEMTRLVVREQVDVAQPRELGFAVRDQVHALAVAREFRADDADLGGRGFHFAFLPRCQVHDVQIAFCDRHLFEHQQFRVVGRPIEHGPCGAAAVAGNRQTRQAAGLRIHDVDVVASAVARGAEKRHFAPGVRPNRRAIQRLAVGEQLRGRLAHALIVKLRVFVAARVLQIHKGAARRVRRKRGLRDRLMQKRELPPRAARCLHQVQLIDIAEARGDEQLSLRRPA